MRRSWRSTGARDVLRKDDANAPTRAHAHAARAGVGGGFIQGNQAEAQPCAGNQPPSVEFDAGTAGGAGDLHFGGGVDALEHWFARVAIAVAIGVMADDPAAVPVVVSSGACAAVGVVR